MGSVMQIVGLGTHILETPRVRKLIETHAEKFLLEVYTEREIVYCRDRTHSTEYYAAFWAAKDAVFRALSIKWRRGINWRDVEIFCDTAIKPGVEITGPTKEHMESLQIESVLVTFSYSRLFATATAIALGNPKPANGKDD